MKKVIMDVQQIEIEHDDGDTYYQDKSGNFVDCYDAFLEQHADYEEDVKLYEVEPIFENGEFKNWLKTGETVLLSSKSK